MGDYGNDLGGIPVMDGGSRLRGGDLKGEDLIDGEVLGGEDAVEAFEGEGSFAVEEVRGDPGRTGAVNGAHDDCLMAMAIAQAVRTERLGWRR